MAEEDLAAAREAEEDERESRRRSGLKMKKEETRTKGGGDTQIAAAKKVHAFSPQLQFFLSSFRFSSRNLGAKLLSLYEHP